MDDDLDSIFRPFQRLPHRGLTRLVASMRVLHISMMKHHWQSVGTEDFPRIERKGLGGVTLSLGVSRRPFTGHISWASAHRGDSSILRILYFEQDKRWYREYTPGKSAEPELDQIIAELFPENTREVALAHEDLVNMMLQHFSNLLDLE
jgi:hypothetical protein